MSNPNLTEDVKKLIITSLKLDKAPADIADDEPLFGGPVPVAVVTAQAETLPVTLEYTAQTLGSREVEVRARVTGILIKRNYSEGGKVKAYAGIVPDSSRQDPRYRAPAEWVRANGRPIRYTEAARIWPGLTEAEYAN